MKKVYPVFNQYIQILFQLVLYLLLVGCAVSPEPELPLNPEPEPQPSVIQKPTLALLEVHEITRSSAIVMGEVKSSGGDSLISTGVVYHTMNGNNITVNSSNNESLYFMINLAELEGGTEYFIKSFAENSAGISYSDEISFKTLPYTSPVLRINQTVATEREFMTVIACAVPDDGGKTVREKGVCWSITSEPTLSDNKVISRSDSSEYEIALNGLQENTTYYLRGYAINEIGTTYSETIVIVVDVDGNVYNTVRIGEQRWMVENLKTTRLNNGTDIGYAPENETWIIPIVVNMTGDPNYKHPSRYPKYCWYDNDIRNKNELGALYNGLAVETGLLAPTGWHVPSHKEFGELIHFLDPDTEDRVTVTINGDTGEPDDSFPPFIAYISKIAGTKLKSVGNKYWENPLYFGNNTGTNESGFNARGAGERNNVISVTGVAEGFIGPGYFIYKGVLTGFWTSTSYKGDKLFQICLARTSSNIILPVPAGTAGGWSVRCVMD